MPEYTVRKMKRQEVDLAIEWAAREGWNPGLHDAECFWAVDPEGWWIGLLDGVSICLKSAVAYDAYFGFMGFYITVPEYRGQGYGLQLWQQANDSLKPRNVGMDGVVAQQANYAKSGYTYAYRQMRYRSVAQAYQVLDSENLVDLSQFDIEALSAFDRQHFPANRTQFLELWISRPGTVALGYVEAGQLKGYAVLRLCREGYKMGPLFAESPDIAETLYCGLAQTAETGQSIYLDVPEPNTAALALVEKYQMQYIFETARMYTQTKPDIKIPQVYGLTSFELG